MTNEIQRSQPYFT